MANNRLSRIDLHRKLHIEILAKEKLVPHASFVHYQSQLEIVQSQLDTVIRQMIYDGNAGDLGETPEQSQARLKDLNRTAKELLTSLNIGQDQELTVLYEDFIARSNRQGLHAESFACLLEVRDQVKLKIAENRKLCRSLDTVHILHDDLMFGIFTNAEIPQALVVLQGQLDKLRKERNYIYERLRDWQRALELAQSAAAAISRAVSYWAIVGNLKSLATRFRTTVLTRASIQKALVLIQLLKSTLSIVCFPHCTNREIAAVTQLVEYMLTDMLIDEKVKYALTMYTSFGVQTTLMGHWIEQTMNNSIGKDAEAIEVEIAGMHTLIQQERNYWIIQRETGMIPPRNVEE